MLVYIIKSVACLAILLVFYKLFLEKESVHQFKRFYLLGALVFSLIVPALVFTEYIEAAPVEAITYIADQQPIQVTQDVIDIPPALEADVLDIEPILWGIYFLGLIFFGLKFIRNLFQIFNRIRKNPKHKLSRFTQVLLQEKITPHTFFSYIFLNKSKFEANQIPKEVILHEETHASQKHSLDVIFIEFLQVIFWINPFIYLTKKAIKLNHEFLADYAVLKNNIDKSTYQNTLLSYLSPDSEKKYQPLANAINYSSIKKRFTVMKIHTSKKAILLRCLLLLPLLAVLIYSFSETSIVQRETSSDTTTIIKDVNIEIDENGVLLLNNKVIALEDIAIAARQLNASLEPYYYRNYVSANILYDENHLELIELVQVELHKTGISNIEHTSKKTATILNRKSFPHSLYGEKTVKEATANRLKLISNQNYHSLNNDKTVLEIVWIEIRNENEIWFNKELTKPEELTEKVTAKHQTNITKKNLEAQIYSKGVLQSSFIDQITNEVRKAGATRIRAVAEEYIMHESLSPDEFDINPETTRLKTHSMTFTSSQDDASEKQIAEYNALAKKYNTMLSKSKSVQIKKKDVDRLEYIYGLMSDKQKAKAEPFPQFPPLPESPRVLKDEKSNTPPPPPNTQKIEEIMELVDKEEAKIREQEVLMLKQETKLVELEILMEKEEFKLEKLEAKLKEIKEETESVKYNKSKVANQEYVRSDNVTVYQHNVGESKTTSPNLMKSLESLAERDAQFYFEGKKISTKEGLRTAKSEKIS